MPARARLASVSLDLDNLWSYMRTHGDPGWEARPTYLPTFVPHLVGRLQGLGLRITIFVVGADTEREENHAPLRALGAAGHEFGNHSYEHEPWLHRYTNDQLEREVARTHEAITRVTGRAPVGFRGPGYSWSPALLETIAAAGYAFDASSLPTFIGPLARAYYFRSTNLTAQQREERAHLFGDWRDGLRPLRPFSWQLNAGRSLLEIPVTTMPLTRAPFHLSYLLYLRRYSEGAALAYLRLSLAACDLAGVEPSFLLHPLDLIGGDEVPELAFFPGMDLPTRVKGAFFDRVLRVLGEGRTLVTMGEHARAITDRGRLPERRPVLTTVGA